MLRLTNKLMLRWFLVIWYVLRGTINLVIRNCILTNCWKSTTKRLTIFSQSRFVPTYKYTYFNINGSIQSKYIFIRRFIKYITFKITRYHYIHVMSRLIEQNITRVPYQYIGTWKRHFVEHYKITLCSFSDEILFWVHDYVLIVEKMES